MTLTPHLAAIPSPPLSWSQWHLGPLMIHAYAIIIVAGIIIATYITNRRLVARGAENWAVLDIALWAVPLGIIVARFYHVFTHVSDYFYPGADLWRVFAIWEGGNAIFGSLIGGAVGVLIGCWRTGIRFWSFADALAPGLLVAQAIGRLGNYFNHELFGLPTTLPWGLEIEKSNPAFPDNLPAGTLFHPTFLYELLLNLLGAALLVFVVQKRWPMNRGRAFGFYCVWYGAVRTFTESIRIDPSQYFLGIRSNVWAAIIAVVVGVIILVVSYVRFGAHPEDEGAYRPGHGPKPAEAAAAGGVGSKASPRSVESSFGHDRVSPRGARTAFEGESDETSTRATNSKDSSRDTL